MNRKYKCLIILGIFLAIAAPVMLSSHSINKAYSEMSSGISCGQAGKALALALTDKTECISPETQHFTAEQKDSWYVPYMEYLYKNNIISAEWMNPSQEAMQTYLTYKQLFGIVYNLKMETDMEAKIWDKNADSYVESGEWWSFYKKVLKQYDTENKVIRNNITLYQTAANLAEAKPWEAYTDIGVLGFDGLSLDYYMGRQILVWMRGTEIIHVIGEEEKIQIEEPESMQEQTIPSDTEQKAEETSIDELEFRVLIQTSGYAQKLHPSLTIHSDAGMILTAGSSQVHIAAGEKIEITAAFSLFLEGNVIAASEGNSEIVIDSINRAQGNPSYPGVLELSVQGNQIAVVNVVEMEEYLKRVVPSEMPERYGLEAAKIQAVCARTYAYQKILAGNYAEYSALVDDSSNYQVYNGIGTRPISSEGVESTRGEILIKDGQVVTPYYFSTSCGYTADNQIWGGSVETFSYLKAQSVTETKEVLDLANEQVFESFIKDWNYPAQEQNFAWYRWKYTMDINTMKEKIQERLAALIAARPQAVTAQNTDGSLKEAVNAEIGTIVSINVITRYSGGIAAELKITGEKQTIIVKQESNIRMILGAPDQTYSNKSESGGGKSEGNYLPSAFFCLEEIRSNGVLTGYTVYGGGNGHGIGMSQNGAYEMTLQGKTYDEILTWFYPSTVLNRI